MIQPVWFTATPARSGFVTAVETHPAGKMQWLTSAFIDLPFNEVSEINQEKIIQLVQYHSCRSASQSSWSNDHSFVS